MIVKPDSPPPTRWLLKIRVRLFALALAGALMAAHSGELAAQETAASSKKQVNSASDLPRFSYPVSSAPSVLLMADDATFNTFAEKVLQDVDSVLRDYDIEDKATLRMLYATRLNVQM